MKFFITIDLFNYYYVHLGAVDVLEETLENITLVAQTRNSFYSNLVHLRFNR